MLNKVRDKFVLHLLRTIYGAKADLACSFYGRDTKCESEISDSASIGIVFQGPVTDEAKLREGLAHYRRLLPSSKIVVSTWEGEIQAEFRKYLQSLQISCVESQVPAVSGIMNVNKQIVSTAQGIASLLRDSSITTIVKTRTDYFPWRPDKAVRQMQVYSRLLGGRARIWGVDFNTRMDLPFSFSDIFQVGPVGAMREYWWGENLYPEDVSVQRFLELTSRQEDLQAILLLQPAEIFLARRYLEGLGCAYNYSSLSDYRAALSEFFGILDSQHIELSFGKYSLAVPGYEPLDVRKKRFVKNADWLAMIPVCQ